MNNKYYDDLNQRIVEGVQLAIKEDIEQHIKEGRPYVVSENGKITWVQTNSTSVEVPQEAFLAVLKLGEE